MAAPASRLPAAEMMRLSRWLGQAEAGGNPTILLTGALGAGKSSFLSVAAREALNRSFQVGTIQLPGPRLYADHSGSPTGTPRQVAQGLPGLADFLRLARLSSERWLVTLDDAHLHEPEEVAALARAFAGSNRPGLLLLISATAAHEGHDCRLCELTARLGSIPGAVAHELGPWSGIDVHDLILTEIDDVAPSVRFGFELAQITGGNPALIRAYAEMAVGLPEEERLTVVSGARRLIDLAPPAHVEQLIHARVAGVSGDERRILQVLALWGLPADVSTLAHLSQLTAAVIESGLNRLEEAGHVTVQIGDEHAEFELTDQVSARVLADTAPSLLARGVHRRASTLLSELELPPIQQILRAQHHLAAPPLDASSARQVVDAAALMLRRGRWATARDLLEPVVLEAIRSDLPAAVLVAAVQLLAETYTHSGDVQTAERLVEATRLRRETAQPGYLEALSRLARGWSSSGRELEAQTTLRYVAAHSNTPREARFRAVGELARLAHWNGEPAWAVELAEYGREMHRGEADAEAELWFQQALISRMRGRPADSLREARQALWLAREAGDRGTAAKSLVAIGESWLDSDSTGRALRWMQGGLRHSERAQSFADVAWVRNRTITAYVEAGRWEQAQLAARRGLSLGASLNLPMTSRRSEAALALLQALAGRVSPTFLRTRIVATDLANPLILTHVAIALFEQQRVAGMAEHARFTIQQAAEMLVDRPGWERLEEIEVLPRLAQDHAAHRDVDGLRQIVSRYQRLAAESPSTLPIARLELMVAQARLAMAEGQPGDAATLLELARSGYQSMDYRWRWASVAGVLGQAYMASERKARAIETLRSGFLALEQLGAHGHARLLRQQLHTVGGRTPRTRGTAAPLTRRQREVATLAARGLSDKEIARELGTTWRTVTTHMHATLKRLDLRSRHELSEWIARNPDSEEASSAR